MVYRVKRKLYGVSCTMKAVWCILYGVSCIVYGVQCKSVSCIVYRVSCIVHRVSCEYTIEMEQIYTIYTENSFSVVKNLSYTADNCLLRQYFQGKIDKIEDEENM